MTAECLRPGSYTPLLGDKCPLHSSEGVLSSPTPISGFYGVCGRINFRITVTVDGNIYYIGQHTLHIRSTFILHFVRKSLPLLPAIEVYKR